MRSSPYSKWNWTYNQLSYPSSSARPFPDCLQVSAPRLQNIHKLQPYCKLQPSVTEHVVTSPEENDTIQKWGEGPPSIRKLGEDACMPWIAWSCAQCRTVASPAFPKTQCQHQPMSTHSYHSTTEKSPQQYNLTKWVPVITLWELAAQKVSDLPSQKIAVTKVAHWLHHKMLLTKDNCCSMQGKEVDLSGIEDEAPLIKEQQHRRCCITCVHSSAKNLSQCTFPKWECQIPLLCMGK